MLLVPCRLGLLVAPRHGNDADQGDRATDDRIADERRTLSLGRTRLRQGRRGRVGRARRRDNARR